ncbi:phytoene desaturase family protein [Pseudopedobacter sp.]|uniref:phytoene desaturase family protein n=1 Tax=Pseudopedobacter sp. TaxID=1936787 RepID=UPI0033426092
MQRSDSRKSIAIIGAGISGLSAAAYAARDGHTVYVFEKNQTPGGRARQFSTNNGYTFDMGPSWYWMPDVIEQFFADFNCSPADYYHLVSLNPQFEMVFADGSVSIPENYLEMKALFEALEEGAGYRLDAFMKSAQYKYEVGMMDFVTKPCYSWLEFASLKILKSAFELDLLTNYRSYVRRYFKHPKLTALMEFPVIFLGASPKNIPALYSLMNYGGYALGTWYPMGGFYELVKAMHHIAEKQGAQFYFNSPVEKLNIKDEKVYSMEVNGKELFFDMVISSSDYHHSETLIPERYRNYSEKYWSGKTFAPSCLIYYLGIKEKIQNLKHHTLFFEPDLDQHVDEIYKTKRWPKEPLFYVCCPSKTDPKVAPRSHENLFLLMPLPIGIDDDEVTRENYLSQMLTRIEKKTGTRDLAEKIDFKKSYCVSNFIEDYNAYKGNAYGLANTLNQTAVLKPTIRNKHLKNLFYTGQLTVPGPGVPPAIISGKIVANEVNKLIHLPYEKII